MGFHCVNKAMDQGREREGTVQMHRNGTWQGTLLEEEEEEEEGKYGVGIK